MIRTLAIAVSLLLGIVQAAAAQDRAATMEFSKAEKAWLEAHQVLKVGNELDWPPFDFVKNGEPKGYAIDMVKLIADKVGVKVEFISGFTWSQLITKFQAGEIDIMPVIGDTPKRREYASFTRSYISNPIVLVAREDNWSVTDIHDLRDKTLAIVSGYYYEDIVRKEYPEIGVVEVSGFVDGLEAVVYGKVDAFMGSLAVVNHTLNETALAGLRIVGPSGVKDAEDIKLSMGVLKHNAILASILQMGLDAVLPEEKEEMRRRWLGAGGIEGRQRAVSARAANAGIPLSDEETAWLKTHKGIKVRVMVGTWPPFHFVEDGEPKGLALEYVKAVLGDLGLEAEFVTILWADALKGITNFEISVDLLPTIARTPEREKLVNITRDYLSFPSVIFSRRESSLIGSLKDLYGRTVSVERNFLDHKRLERDHPDIKLHIAETSTDALAAVSLGKAAAYVGNLATGSYIIEKQGFANLKVAAPTDYANNIQAMGVRRDWPELASMIDKGLSALSEEQHAKLRRNALAIRFETGVDVQTILAYPVNAHDRYM